MKVGDQAMYLAQLRGMSSRDAARALKDWFVRFGIQDWWNKKVEELSKGMAQKVQFITTVVHKPSLMILDEPFSGFDPVNADLIRKEILRLKEEGATIILSSSTRPGWSSPAGRTTSATASARTTSRSSTRRISPASRRSSPARRRRPA